jgi:5-dehydro-2-deoxygluconokinase
VTPEVLTVGRVSVDLYPEQIAVPLCGRAHVSQDAGRQPDQRRRRGCPARAPCGGGDEGRRRSLRRLRAAGTRRLRRRRVARGQHPTLRTPLAFCEIFPPDRFPLLFYRVPKAPDLELESDDLDVEEAAAVPLLWTTGTGLSEEPSRSTTLAAPALRGRRSVTVHDLDYRDVFWPSPEEAARWNREAVAQATVVVGNEAEVAVTVGEELRPEHAAQALRRLGPDLAVVKLGEEGVLGATSERAVVVPPMRVEVVNGLGAGDGFGGALCHGLLAGWPLERTLRFANAAGALVASRLGCADDMPTLAEVEELLCAA